MKRVWWSFFLTVRLLEFWVRKMSLEQPDGECRQALLPHPISDSSAQLSTGHREAWSKEMWHWGMAGHRSGAWHKQQVTHRLLCLGLFTAAFMKCPGLDDLGKMELNWAHTVESRVAVAEEQKTTCGKA